MSFGLKQQGIGKSVLFRPVFVDPTPTKIATKKNNKQTLKYKAVDVKSVLNQQTSQTSTKTTIIAQQPENIYRISSESEVQQEEEIDTEIQEV